jgi:ADP-heptose:LPS heptosyltransferase
MGIFERGIKLLLPKEGLPKLSKIPMEEVKRVVVFSNTNIGNTLFSTPIFRELKKNYPEKEIYALLNPANASIFQNNPHLTGIFLYPGTKGEFGKALHQLRNLGVDLIIIAHSNEPEATPLAVLSGAKYILQTPNKNNPFNRWHNNPPTTCFPCKHETLHQLESLKYLGIEHFSCHPEIFIEQCWRREGEKKLRSIWERRLIGLQIGASTPSKKWYPQRWVELGKALLKRYPEYLLILTGSMADREEAREIARQIGGNRVVNVAGLLSLGGAVALLERLELLISPDTGPLHLAATVGTKTIGLFSPTSPTLNNPCWDRNIHLPIFHPRPCPKCSIKECQSPFCMGQIQVEEVLHATQLLLG